MKKDEAISILATSPRPREPKDRARYDEAVEMAIDALSCSEFPNNSDTISRQQAIDKFKPWLEVKGYGWGELNMLRAVISELENMPSVQPEQRWIPVSERLPDDLAEVNVTWINHEPEPYYDFVKDKPFTASAVYYKGDWYWYSSVCVDVLAEYGENRFDKIADVIEITAWMPFPEPYQKRGDQDGMEK